MEVRLEHIDRAEALRYLGCSHPVPPPELAESADRAIRALLELARPRAVWARFPLEGRRLAGTDYDLAGEDIMAHLAGCGEVILLAATLGQETEVLLRRSQVRDLAYGLVLDCCASAAMESVCDGLEAKLRQEAAREGKRLTGRFSPGYGDWPLSHQRTLCRLLDGERRIGLTLTPGGLMLPRKSVTALLGLSAGGEEQRKEDRCLRCPRREDCERRKGGGSCEK